MCIRFVDAHSSADRSLNITQNDCGNKQLLFTMMLRSHDFWHRKSRGKSSRHLREDDHGNEERGARKPGTGAPEAIQEGIRRRHAMVVSRRTASRLHAGPDAGHDSVLLVAP